MASRTVVASTRVHAASREHPDAPYTSGICRTGGGKLSPFKTKQTAQPGDELLEKPSFDITTIGVVGTGQMGVGIAALCAAKGFNVVLKSRREETARSALEAISRQLRKTLGTQQAANAIARVSTTTRFQDLKCAQFVVESIVEDEAAKREAFRQLGENTPPTTVIATNTSSIQVGKLAAETAHPNRVVGMHFFNPVHAMQLVEIVRPQDASGEAVAKAGALAEALGKTAITVKDSPGFIVNRLLLPQLNDAARLVQEGVASAEEVDEAVRLGLNHPMGPLRLIDLIGVDTAVEVLRQLHAQTGEKHFAPCKLLEKMLAEGKLGRKAGEGFYTYKRK
ncbi:MAG: 3-hydroxyacyl-CoA dehydrogenase family protein [Candidatus Micrarchaeota archaeon]